MDGKSSPLPLQGFPWSGGRRRAITPKLVVILVSGLCYMLSGLPAEAQDNPTSTPDANGFIYTEVQPEDSLWGIAARAGLTIPELLALNELDETVVLQPGERLITGFIAPLVTETPDIPTPTLPPPSATPTAMKQRTALCVMAYEDVNRNGHLESEEPFRANVAFTIFNEQQVVTNYVTDGVSEPHCLEDLQPGVYHVTRSLTKNETLTTEGDWALTLSVGSVLNLAFGSYQDEVQVLEPTPNADEQLSTRLALTPEATPTEIIVNRKKTASTASVMIGLVVASFSLLVGLAVLTFLFVQRRKP